ncbi:cytochrome c oxidase assembly protein [Micromonospora sp. HM5-17]|jgi:cytochrome c oxidase assembly factor CtaG|uniref:cytochrome c oxidase assembly protein n=1 Tax=Micromonospora sp. HM5-17 TaxID=2487710 RepID=UPI000F492570|nr:cytochrome c oxidase assembly protein [Micromonospora sp. HM5-17]ROT28183.1 cytochrome c oxidase assembly protein [Micromonospora sp. HM5-17]
MPALTDGSAGGGPLAYGDPVTQAWSNLLVVTVLALLCAGYGRGVHELWSRRGTGAVVARWRVAGFALGIAAVLVASTGPGHVWAERSFAGHMGQHMILLVVAGPALAAAAPGLPLALAAPRRLRRRWARWRTSTAGSWVRRRPGALAVLAGVLHAAVLWGWHLPAPYRLAAEHGLVHAAEHASFVVAAALLWSVLLGADRHRISGPAAVLVLVATMLAASALGAALTLAPGPVYPAGILAPHGGDPEADQQLAGLLMWIPMDVAVLVAASVVFLRWLAGLDRALPRASGLPPEGPAGPVPRGPARADPIDRAPARPAAGKDTR